MDGLQNVGSFYKSRSSMKKRRKTRTAFTNQQIFQLEKRFVYQKYLTPSDRDEIATTLRLSNAQVITWFQNRRAKLKRDLEELKADVTAAKALGNEPSSTVLHRLEELMKANEHGLKKKEVKTSSVEKERSRLFASKERRRSYNDDDDDDADDDGDDNVDVDCDRIESGSLSRSRMDNSNKRSETNDKILNSSDLIDRSDS